MLNQIQNKIKSAPEALDHFKVRYSEKKAIKHKRAFYRQIAWSGEQQNAFDEFWEKAYGKKIKPYWNKLYESMNGVFHYDYLPEMLYTTELEPILVKSEYARIFNNKSLIEFLYGGVDGVRLPKTYLTCCNGVFRNAEQQLLSREDALAYCADLGHCVMKPTVDTGSGSGVSVMNLVNGKDMNDSAFPLEVRFSELEPDFIIQEKIQESAAFSAVYPDSVNTIRLMTYLVGTEVHHVPLVMRIGVNHNKVDNIHAGGLCVGVNESGTLKKYAYQLGYGDTAIKFEKHPDTDVVFEGYSIGDVQKVIRAAENLHRRAPHIGMFSWDFTMDANNEVVLIEANCKDQSVWFPQIVNECPLFGEDTEYFLNMLRDCRK